MLAKVQSGAVVGVDGLAVEVEVDIALGLPFFTTVGLPDGSVRESKDRVKAAIRNCGYEFPNRRITVNLAPADIKKAGAGFDLPMALGILAATETLKSVKLDQYWVLGELSLDGTVRPVRGVLPITLAARDLGMKGILVPQANRMEAAVVDGIDVIAVDTLHQAVEFLAGIIECTPFRLDPATSATDFPFSRTLAKRVVISWTAPIKIVPNTAHNQTGKNPKRSATVGPITGPPPAMLEK